MPKRKESRPTISDADPYQWIDAAVANTADMLCTRNSAQYDGVLGFPPDWFPQDAQEAFLVARNRLLDAGGFDKGGYVPEVLRRLIAEAIAENEAAIAQPDVALNQNTFMVPPTDRKDIYTLAHLWSLSQLDPEKALEKWSGKDAASGYKSRTAHRKRADHFEKQDVQVIGLKLWRENPSLTIAAIERSPEMRIYKRRYRGHHTLRDWIKEIDTRPKKTGRPRHS